MYHSSHARYPSHPTVPSLATDMSTLRMSTTEDDGHKGDHLHRTTNFPIYDYELQAPRYNLSPLLPLPSFCDLQSFALQQSYVSPSDICAFNAEGVHSCLGLSNIEVFKGPILIIEDFSVPTHNSMDNEPIMDCEGKLCFWRSF